MTSWADGIKAKVLCGDRMRRAGQNGIVKRFCHIIHSGPSDVLDALGKTTRAGVRWREHGRAAIVVGRVR